MIREFRELMSQIDNRAPIDIPIANYERKAGSNPLPETGICT